MGSTARLRRLLLLLALAMASAGIGAEDGRHLPHQLDWQQWTVADGLPQITVNAIVQDQAGFLWIATQEGVARFDGLDFESYGLSEHPGLGHSVVHALAFDAEDALWIGTMGGVARLQQGRIEPVPTADEDDPTGVVLSMSSDSKGRVLVAAQHGLFRSDGQRLRRVDTGLGRTPVVTTLVPRDHPPAVVLPAHLVIDPEGQRRVIPLEDRLPSTLSALLTSEGLWVGTIGGLFLLDLQGEVLSVHAPGREIERLAVDPDGRLWAATDQGLWLRAPGEQARPVDVPGIDQRAWVRSLAFDREGTLWVGTQLSGLHRGHAARFRRLGTRDGLPEGAVWAVYEAADGELWAGTPDGVYRGGLHGFQAALPVESLPHPMVVGLLKDRSGTVWLGTRYGLTRLRPGASAAEPVPGVGENMVGALLEDHDGSVLAGSLDGLFRIRDGQVSRERLPGSDGGSNVNALAHDALGRVWVGYEQGVAILEAGTWQAIGGGDDAGPRPMSLSPLGADSMLAASFEGLFLASASSGIRRLGTEQGLHIDWVTWTALHRDALWYLSVRGIGRLPITALGMEGTPPQGRVYGDFGAAYLAQCNGGHQAAGALTEGRWLWCPSLDGLLVLDLERLATPEPGPPVQIRRLSSPRRQLIPNAGDAPLALGADERDLRFDYTALHLQAAEQVRFEGRLVGYDRDWLALEARRSAFYTNLGPGRYRFELRAISEDGLRGEVSTLAFQLAPYWHETWAARAAAVLLLALAIWLLMRGRLHLVQRQRERLAAEVAARTRELQIANRQLEQASLTDPLTGLHNRRFLAQHLPIEIARVDRLHSEGPQAGADFLFLQVDLDHFKSVNDRYGHAVGDEVLVEVARRLKAMARGSDLVLRWGGEEFLLVGPDSDRRYAADFARRVLDVIRSAPIPTRAGPVQLTASLGYAAYPALPGQSAASSWEQVLDLADAATYLAKADGRNRAVGVRLLRPIDDPAQARRLHDDARALEAEGWIEIQR